MNLVNRLYPPLRYPDGWPDPPGRVELIGRWIPLFGWLVSAILEQHRLGPGCDHVLAQLAQREPIPDSAWGDDPRMLEVARTVVAKCVEAIGWEHPYFQPNDPFEIMIELRTGDMCELDAIMRIEKAFEIQLGRSEADVQRWIDEPTTFAEIVDWILATSPRYSALPGTSDKG